MKKKLIRKNILEMSIYSPPLEGRTFFEGHHLDFNERTVAVHSEIREALHKLVEGKLELYPEYFDLDKVIAEYCHVREEQVLSTNGSDQAIDIIFRTFVNRGDKVLLLAPSFPIFMQVAKKQDAKIVIVPYSKNRFEFPVKEVLKKINKKTKMVVVVNPNNPTGTGIDLQTIEKILKKLTHGVLFLDEAYYEYQKIGGTDLLNAYPNLIITRTFSKAFGLPSVRIGYIIAAPQMIEEIRKIKSPYDVNIFAVAAAKTALKNPDYALDYAKHIIAEAKPMVENFFKENNVLYIPSTANFILFKPTAPIEVVYKILKENGILIRIQKQESIVGWGRVTIGIKEQMENFISIYKEKILTLSQKIAFLDRDGTLIHEPDKTFQIDRLKKLKILKGVFDGLQTLQTNGYKLVMITNQDGLGTKHFPQKKFDVVQKEFLRKLKKHGIVFDEIFVCPHTMEDKCECRKPKLGMVRSFLEKATIDNDHSFVCGDRDTDKQFAEHLGIPYFSMKRNGNFADAMKNLEKLK